MLYNIKKNWHYTKIHQNCLFCLSRKTYFSHKVFFNCSFQFLLVHYCKQSNVMTMGFTRPHFRQVAHAYYQLFHSKMANGDQLWSVPKLENDLLRRNASTHGRQTDLIERYILHRKPKHTIYVRYFSIFLYLLNECPSCPD